MRDKFHKTFTTFTRNICFVSAWIENSQSRHLWCAHRTKERRKCERFPLFPFICAYDFNFDKFENLWHSWCDPFGHQRTVALINYEFLMTLYYCGLFVFFFGRKTLIASIFICFIYCFCLISVFVGLSSNAILMFLDVLTGWNIAKIHMKF